jgi:uncharacterized LabA/DUF88 family protein
MIPELRLKLAVFIDFDNIEIGVKNTLNAQLDIGLVFEALKERGDIVSKTAYSDWKRAGDHSRFLTQHAIKMVQRNLTPGGDKNGADINLALDALEMAFTHSHINGYVIVGGDSDFISLVEKLKQYDKKVFIVGGRQFTSAILQKNCHEFIAYENLVGTQRRVADRGRPAPAAAQTPVTQAFPLVRRALKLLADREVSPQLGLLKSTLLQLDSTFSERSYGASTFRDFAEKMQSAGLVRLRDHGRSMHVELRSGDEADDAGQGFSPAVAPVGTVRPEPVDGPTRVPPVGVVPRPVETETAAAGFAALRRIFSDARTPLRWPMYLRNVKQVLRGVDPTFDERRYGFANLVDLLRAAQREGLVRIERNRQGALRVFPGNNLQLPAPAPADGEPLIIDAQELEPVTEPVDGEIAEPAVVEAAEQTETAAAAAEYRGGEPAEKPARRRRAKGTGAPRAKSRTPRTRKRPSTPAA